MTRQVKRNVNREGLGGRQAIVRAYGSRAWYELPDWSIDWLVANAGWLITLWALFLAPATLLALVLGAHALPLEFFGIPAADNGVGLAAIILIITFVLLALAIRPLFRRQRKGALYVVTATIVHFAGSLVLQHGISGFFEVVVVVYLYWQLQPKLQ